MKNFAILTTAAVVCSTLAMIGVEKSDARKVVSGGAINGPVVMSCTNGMRERWFTNHAPRDSNFFHQEVILGEGDYTISMIPNGGFPFNAFVYNDANKYIGGRQNVRSYSHRFRVTDWAGKKFLIQMKKTANTCAGCGVTMAITARNCPASTPGIAAPMCKPNQCYKDAPFGTGQCVPKQGARGGYC